MTRFPPYALALVLAIFMTGALKATPLQAIIDIQGQGLQLANGGVGLEGLGSSTRTLDITVGGTVQSALLYWAGREFFCAPPGGVCTIPSQPYKDQVLLFDGNLLTGTLVGSEPQIGGNTVNNIGYRADVTSIVQAKGTGALTFTVADGDLTSNLTVLNGAGLIVVYTDPLDTDHSRVIVFDGLDFAYGPNPAPGPPEALVTVPVEFAHGASASARVGELTLFVGDGEEPRPDRIEISNNASISDALDGSDGPAWDTDRILVNIPAGVSATTVQLISEPVDPVWDSLLWTLGAMRVPLGHVRLEGCTPGYWKNHTASWAPTGFSPGQVAGSVFVGMPFPTLAAKTLLQSLQGGGGTGTLGAATILLRAAVAGLLNASHPDLTYPRTAADVISAVQAALGSNDRGTMLALATALDNENQLGCDIPKDEHEQCDHARGKFGPSHTFHQGQEFTYSGKNKYDGGKYDKNDRRKGRR